MRVPLDVTYVNLNTVSQHFGAETKKQTLILLPSTVYTINRTGNTL